MTDAFDSDVLIFAATDDPRGAGVERVLATGGPVVGSVVLIPETMSRPMRNGDQPESERMAWLLNQIELKPVDRRIADAAVAYGAAYGLRAADAIHLATAVAWGAARFHTNNRKDFGPHITEVEVVWPEARPE